MDKVKVVRRQRKAAITRHLGDLERLMSEEDVDGLAGKLETIKVSFGEFAKVHDQYQAMLVEDAAFDESEAWFAEAEQNYIRGVKAARAWLHKQSDDDDRDTDDDGNDGKASESGDTIVTVNESVEAKDLVNLLSIPKVEIDTFSGNPSDYHTFMAVFDETIGNKAIDDQMKLTRLLHYTAGHAKMAIRNCVIVGGSQGYKQARSILEDRFGNSHLVSQQIISDLKHGKSVSKGSDLLQLSDDLTTAVATLESLKMFSEIDNQRTILDILARCPPYVGAQWRTKALKTKQDTQSYPVFKDFVKFITLMAQNA